MWARRQDCTHVTGLMQVDASRCTDMKRCRGECVVDDCCSAASPLDRSCGHTRTPPHPQVRQSWVNRPLTPAEEEQLSSAARLGGYLCAALPLVVHELRASAHQLHHLYPHLLPTTEGGGPAPLPVAPALSANAADAYEHEWRQLTRSGWGTSAARLWGLSPAEEQRVLGRVVPSRASQPGFRRRGHFTAVQVPDCPVPPGAVAQWEELLAACVQQGSSRADPRATRRATQLHDPSTKGLAAPKGGAGSTHPPYPLGSGHTTTTLDQQMHSELERSWVVHHAAVASGTPVAPLASLRVPNVAVSGLQCPTAG